MLQERKWHLVEEGRTIKFTDNESIYFDLDKGVRLESSRLDYKKGNKELDRKDYFQGEIRVVNPSIQNRYFKDRNYGEIRQGFSSDIANLFSAFSVPSLSYAGKSLASKAIQLEYLVSAESVETPEGPGIQLVYHYEWKPGSGMLYFTTILPDKAYSVYEEKKYANGRIHLHDIYDNYKEISSGIWYPMHQKNTTIPSANLPPGIQDKLVAGELNFLSPEVLQSQIYEMHQITERWIEKVELDILIEEKQFTFDFPSDTTVKDYTKINEDGRSLY